MDLDRFRYYTAWHDHANQRYDAPADPWKLLRVDPREVTHYNGEPRLDVGLGRVQGGSWDHEQNCRPMRETTLYRGLKQRFEEGRAWEDTDLYRAAKERFESGETVRGYDGIEEFHSVRCEYVDDLYHEIEREGYRPNAQAGHRKAADNDFEDAYANHLEPLVAIGRDGEIQWLEGNHRFTIASLLGIEIPVYVLCRHERWQAVRDRIARAPGDPPPELADHLGHPDLRDLEA